MSSLPSPIIYNFNIIVRIFELIHQGTATLTLVLKPNSSYDWILRTQVPNMHNPNLFDLSGIGFLISNSFNSAYKGNVLNFNLATGVLNLYDVQTTLQLQGTQVPQPQPQPQPNPVNPTNGGYDTTYNTYNNFNGCGGSNSGPCSKCGSTSCCGGGSGVTNIINLNNRND